MHTLELTLPHAHALGLACTHQGRPHAREVPTEIITVKKKEEEDVCEAMVMAERRRWRRSCPRHPPQAVSVVAVEHCASRPALERGGKGTEGGQHTNVMRRSLPHVARTA